MPMDRMEEARQAFLDALALHERGELERARALYEKALELAPGRPSVMNNLAAVLIGLQRFADARALCERIVALDPGDGAALVNLGACRFRLGSVAEARDAFEAALRISPGNAEAQNHLAVALQELQRPEEALAGYDRALALRPDYAEAHYNRGDVLLELGRPEEALAAYDRALAVKPDYAEAHYNRGNVLRKLQRPEDALSSYDRALDLRPDSAPALVNRGHALRALGRREELIGNYRRLLTAAPETPYARGYLLNEQLQCCDWTGYDESVAEITDAVRDGRAIDTPFNFLAISGSAADELRCARTYAAREHPAAPEALWRGEGYRHGRIRVAYVSADFHAAMAIMMTGLFEAHDRARFELTGISLGPEPSPAVKRRLSGAFDRFIEAASASDREVAGLLRDQEIDIAVDLQGYTRGCRPGIFAHRAAPVQAGYLGYPGTMGAGYIDYVIGDRQVIPPEHHAQYSEKVVSLPDSYQVSYARPEPPRIPGRQEMGLPQRGFVFCCFNNNFKLTPAVFDRWMRLLRKVEDSVLWLFEDNSVAARNLQQEAGRRGVAPERLVFARRAGFEEYLARYRLADLFLDTLPYNAHATASDALWAGVPVLTCQGRTFSGRVAASLLNAAGLPELIAATGNDYEKLALRLAEDRALLDGFRARLARNRATHPLFDAERFRRHLEAAYVAMWERARRGEPPAAIEVPALGPGDAR